MKIRTKIQAGGIIIALVVLFTSVLIYHKVDTMVDAAIHRELSQAMNLSYGVLDSSINSSVKNYLRGIAKNNLEIVRNFYKQI